MMGAGIAHANASRGIACVLKDVSASRRRAPGRGRCAKLAAQARWRAAAWTSRSRRSCWRSITPTADAADLNGCDLIIEAVFEQRELKAQVTREAEPMLAPGGVFASNTSTLPISGLAAGEQRAASASSACTSSRRSHKMKLVEIIRGEADRATRRWRAPSTTCCALGKTPIVVNDSRGFFTSRVFGTFVMEGAAMLAEGIAGAADRARRRWRRACRSGRWR